VKPVLSWVSRSDTLKFFCSPIDWHRTSFSCVNVILWFPDLQTQQIMLIICQESFPLFFLVDLTLIFFNIQCGRGCLIKLIDSPSACQWLVEEWSCDTVWPISRSLLWCRILEKVFFALHKSCPGESDSSFPVLRSHCLHVIILLRSWGRTKWRKCINKMKMRSDERGRIQFLDDFIELLN